MEECLINELIIDETRDDCLDEEDEIMHATNSLDVIRREEEFAVSIETCEDTPCEGDGDV